MNFVNLLIVIILVILTIGNINAQINSGFKRFSPVNSKTYVTDMNGDGRFVVIESEGNIATYNPRNTDGNREIFLLDYAQRHIFQLTDTKSALKDTNLHSTQQSNILVVVGNYRPEISNDGHWIAFSSNATTSTPSSSNSTNPGNFDGNGGNTPQMLQQDGGTELWTYQLPAFQSIDLSVGDVPLFADLGAGSFTQITNTLPSRLPVPGTTTTSPIIADDNREASVDDNGSTVSFTSSRDLVLGNNASPDNNDEIFVYKRIGQSGNISQVTRTPKGSIAQPIYNVGSSISGNGGRVDFLSNATNPVIGMSGGCNSEFNTEVYFTDLDNSGSPDGIKRQVTFTTPVDYNPTVFQSIQTRTISRDGKYITLISRAKLDAVGGSVDPAFADYIYDTEVAMPVEPCKTNPNQFRQMGPRYNADNALPYGDQDRYPRFTDYNPATLTPGTVVFSSKINFRSDGTVPSANSGEGLNQSPSRPAQIYAYSLSGSNAFFTRLSNSPVIDWGSAIFAVAANLKSKIASTIVDSGNTTVAGFYLITPNITQEDSIAALSFFTGASAIPIPSQAQGLMTNMLGAVTYQSQLTSTVSGSATSVSNSRNFVAPLELKGVSITIDGVAANITRVSSGQINFIVPPDITSGNKPFVINHNGIILRGTIPIVSAPQPDILTNQTEISPSSGGRARVLNVTDPNNPLSEPFAVTTQTPSGAVPTRLRLFVTGVRDVAAASIAIRVGSVDIPPSSILTGAVATDYPGVFSIDFILPEQLSGAGDSPIVVTVNYNGQLIASRSATTAPRLQIRSNQLFPNDFAVW